MKLSYSKTNVRCLAPFAFLCLTVVLGSAGHSFAQGQDIKGGADETSPAKKDPPKKTPPTQTPAQPKTKTGSRSPNTPATPDALIDIIKAQQKLNVRESFGTQSGENFSDDDLKAFVAEKKVERIQKELRDDADFRAIVAAIKALKPDKRVELFNEALTTYKKTWAELHKITPEGQTDAGQKAEKMIAEGIVDLAKEMLAPPKTKSY